MLIGSPLQPSSDVPSRPPRGAPPPSPSPLPPPHTLASPCSSAILNHAATRRRQFLSTFDFGEVLQSAAQRERERETEVFSSRYHEWSAALSGGGARGGLSIRVDPELHQSGSGAPSEWIRNTIRVDPEHHQSGSRAPSEWLWSLHGLFGSGQLQRVCLTCPPPHPPPPIHSSRPPNIAASGGFVARLLLFPYPFHQNIPRLLCLPSPRGPDSAGACISYLGIRGRRSREHAAAINRNFAVRFGS